LKTGIALSDSGPLLTILTLLKLLAQSLTRNRVGACLALSLDIAPALCGPVKNVVGRLNETGRFEFTQEIARGDEAQWRRIGDNETKGTVHELTCPARAR